VLQSYQEFQLANTIFYAMKENYTSEQGARMVSMDGASKNAGQFATCIAVNDKTQQLRCLWLVLSGDML